MTACQLFDIHTVSETLKQIKLVNYEWGHYVTTIYDEIRLGWSEKEQLLALFVQYKSAHYSPEEKALVANLWYAISNYAATAPIKDEGDESMEEPDQEELRSNTGSEADDVLEGRPQMGWQEYIGRQLCENHPSLVSQKGISGDVQTILELAIGHEAYWVIPEVDKNDNYFRKAATEKLRVALRKDENPNTVLSQAIQRGNVETIKRVVALCEHFEIEPARDEFILQNAILKKNVDVVDILLNAFGDLIAHRRNEKSALEELRALGDFEGKEEIEKSLVSKIVRLNDIALSRQLLYDSCSMCS